MLPARMSHSRFCAVRAGLAAVLLLVVHCVFFMRESPQHSAAAAAQGMMAFAMQFGPRTRSQPTDGELKRCGARVQEMLKAGELEQACKLFAALPCGEPESAEKRKFLKLLGECAAEGGSSRVKRILEYMWENPGLEPDLACFRAAIRSCLETKDLESASELLQEISSWGLARASPTSTRFQLAPWIKWDQDIRRAGCSARNDLQWEGNGPVPDAPPDPCWLLPSQDDIAVLIASRSHELLQHGWRVFQNDPGLVSVLRNKVELHKHAERLALEHFMPKRYVSASSARYPCVLKAAIGTWGSDMCIARSEEDVASFLAKRCLSEESMLLQELLPGQQEFSTTLLTIDGEIFDYICTKYKYDREEYVWPDATELNHCCQSVPESHLKTMAAFLPGYTGIINFNYKVRKCGTMCIFETNPRVGADFAFDVPRPRVRQLLEKLDAVLGRG
eukprot:TRINITY_DN79829_c0_g1_i1.p1 TRINITY_DN79829_c0_g1~~TRINITY_DN79829_c0_g1_i1.p1  ORF type:complete len:447 (-),score=90.99 TRINITY_DN79829_c0_g1_i1:170-1510(-)